jgi:hypothetical protein
VKRKDTVFGLGQIRAIVEKYEGMLDIYEQDGMFCSLVMISSE